MKSDSASKPIRAARSHGAATRKTRDIVHMAALVLGVGAALEACGDDTESCTTEIRAAVIVEVSAPSGLSIDGVTVEQADELACVMSDATSSNGSKTFTCMEQAPGTYAVRVHSGSLTWTRTLELAADPDNPCHVKSPPAELEVVLNQATAD